MEIIMYIDGACKGNPGPGGWSVILKQGRHYKELSGGVNNTTNNRMELMALIKGLEALKIPRLSITVYCDSTYVVEGATKWLDNWVRTKFLKKKNKDLWLRFHELSLRHKIRFIWVKGHAENRYNNRCDELAVQAYKKPNLQIDWGYEPA